MSDNSNEELLAEIDLLRDDLHTQYAWVQWAKGEIDRLRERLAAAEAENGFACRLVAKMHLAATGETTGPTLGVVEDVLALRQRAERAERILAALREPSVNLQAAAFAAFEAHDDMEAALKAAVAAAEQEVRE